MNIKAIAIDDEPLALEIVKQYCKQLPDITLIQTFDNAISGLDYINEYKPDLLFIDIDMPDINGIDLINNIKEKPMIIFTTAYKEFALQGFELEAIDYLLKPFSFERFEKAFKKALLKHKANNDKSEEYIFIYSEYRMIKILLQDILYVESLDDYIKIHFTNDKPVMTLMSLKKIAEKLPTLHFLRIHRSYIVSSRHLTQVYGRKIKLTDGTELPMGERYAAEINKIKKLY